MNVSLRFFIILAVLAGAPIERDFARSTATESAEVFRCTFEEAYDANYDRWPDEWTRRTGRGYPRYLEVQIEPDPSAASNHCLTMHLDGGAAAAITPRIAVVPHDSYVASCRIRTAGLHGHGAVLRLTALDESGTTLQELATLPIRDARDWTTVNLGPWSSHDDRVCQVVLSLHLEAQDAPDLFGTASFDDLRLVRVPHISLTANAPLHLYSDLSAPRITCRVTGVHSDKVPVQLALHDAQGHCVATHLDQLQLPDPAATRNDAGDPGQFEWQPPIAEYGFYRITASVQLTDDTALERTLSLVVFPPAEDEIKGEFGWNFPTGSHELSIKQLATLTEFAGLGWVKLPVWFAAGDKARADDLAWLAERLSRQRIELVGVLDIPPASEIEKHYGDVSRLPAALAFADAQAWQPLVDPVLTRLSLKTRWWQIGSDEDTSYVDLPDAEARLRSIQDYFRRFSQDSQLGVVWPWLDGEPRVAKGIGSFVARTSTPPLTAAELVSYLSEPAADARDTWVQLRPLPAQLYDVPTRIRDLALRMLAIKRGHAATAMVSDPFDQACGLLNRDGTPRELLVPWTILARELGGAEYIGSMTLPAGSTAYVFARGNEALLAVWNDVPVTERLYLGDPRRLRAMNLWGHTVELATEQQDQMPVQAVPVDSLPLLIRGANLPIARLRIDFAFDTQEIASTPGRDHRVALHFTNHFPQGIGGTVHIQVPDTWNIAPRDIPVRMAAGEQQAQQFQVRLGTNATCGNHIVRFDFDIRADEHLQFSIHRPLKVGLGDVTFELSTHLDEHGTLFVEQQLVNLSDRAVDFNCLLFLPNQKRERTKLLRIPRGRHSETYAIPNGSELVGQMLWLRAEEIAGQNRVLNYQAPIEP